MSSDSEKPSVDTSLAGQLQANMKKASDKPYWPKTLKEEMNTFLAACEEGHVTALEDLLASGAKVQHQVYLRGLERSVLKGRVELTRSMVLQKRNESYLLANIEILRYLPAACRTGNFDCMQALLSRDSLKDEVKNHHVEGVLANVRPDQNPDLDGVTRCLRKLITFENVIVDLQLFNAAADCSTRCEYSGFVDIVAKAFQDAPDQLGTCRDEAFADSETEYGVATAIGCLETASYGEGEDPRCLLELELISLMAAIRDKPDWRKKINDETIVSKWRQEADMSQQHFDLAIAELRWLVTYSEKYTEVQPAAADGVFCLDSGIDDELQFRLQRSVDLLRSRPAVGSDDIDRHPGTENMIDLVHPSLYAYERGVSALVGSASTYKQPAWNKFIGIDSPVEAEEGGTAKRGRGSLTSDIGLQWLPAEFYVDAKECKILSYINSLHPKQYPQLYKDLAALFYQAVPAFEAVLSEVGAGPQARAFPIRVHCDPYAWWEGGDVESEDEDDWDNDNRTFIPPVLPEEFDVPNYYALSRKFVSLKNRPLQVIVKIASLELEPGDSYAGGTWHIEGMKDERIVATSCYYLNSENVQGGTLGFRTAVCEPEYEQGDDRGIQRAFGLANDEPLVQPRGSCSTPQGRLLAWPNTLQHCVNNVELIDQTKPGRRTIICFFLVDPTLRVRSTAQVPPQPREWISLELTAILISRIPSFGLRRRIAEYVSGCTFEQAAERRDRLMSERFAVYQADSRYGDKFFERTFSLCEH